MGWITLQPVSMITPTKECIYAPSNLHPPFEGDHYDLERAKKYQMTISFHRDGKSNPRRVTVYGVHQHQGYHIVKDGTPEAWSIILGILLFGSALGAVLITVLM